MKKVYVIMCVTGERDYEYMRPVLVVDTEEEAEGEVEKLSSTTPEYSSHREVLDDRIRRVAAYIADKVGDVEEWGDVYTSSYLSLMEKADAKYPHLTSDYDLANSWYFYEECQYKGEE